MDGGVPQLAAMQTMAIKSVDGGAVTRVGLKTIIHAVGTLQSRPLILLGGIIIARSPIKQLYERLLQASEIPIIESAILSKGLYLTEDGRKEIHIKQSLNHREKLKVLLHEYSHHIHLTHHFNHESRAECEVIANGSAFFISREFGLKLYKEFDLSTFSENVDVVTRVEAIIQIVARDILSGLKEDEDA